MNASIFRVHAFFICLVLVMMGLPSLVEPAIFLTPTRAGLWLSGSFAVFWAIRLYCQWFVYERELWREKRLETALHFVFSGIWGGLTLLYSACAAIQLRLL